MIEWNENYYKFTRAICGGLNPKAHFTLWNNRSIILNGIAGTTDEKKKNIQCIFGKRGTSNKFAVPIKPVWVYSEKNGRERKKKKSCASSDFGAVTVVLYIIRCTPFQFSPTHLTHNCNKIIFFLFRFSAFGFVRMLLVFSEKCFVIFQSSASITNSLFNLSQWCAEQFYPSI